MDLLSPALSSLREEREKTSLTDSFYRTRREPSGLPRCDPLTTLPPHLMPATHNSNSESRAPHGGSGLVPSLSLFTTVMIVVGGVIGSGIFRKPGVMAGQVGSTEILLGVWILAGVLTLIGALCIAEISATLPETGGQYAQFDNLYGPFVAYLYGWAVFAVMQTGSIAALAYVFSEYATQFVRLPEITGPAAAFAIHLPFIGDISPLKEIGVKGLATCVILLLTAINYLGTRFGGWVQNIFTIAKISGMAVLFLAAFLLPSGGTLANLRSDNPAVQLQGLALWAAIAAALQGAFWAYDGWNKVTYIAGEVRDPVRNVPRSLVLGMTAVTLIYVSMNIAYAYVLPNEVMSQSKLVAADVAEKCVSGGGKWIALVVMISTFGAANATILASARVYFSMAHRNVFPKVLGVVHPRFHTPAAALIVQALWSIMLLFSGTFDTLTDTLIFVSWFFNAATAYGVIVLRRREPNAHRPYKAPGYPYLPILFVLFAIIYLILTIYYDITSYQAAVAAGRPAIINSALGAFLVGVGIPIYFFYRKRAKSRTDAV